MKILITNDSQNVVVVTDFSDITQQNSGLIGQAIMELKIIIDRLMNIYVGGGDEEDEE